MIYYRGEWKIPVVWKGKQKRKFMNYTLSKRGVLLRRTEGITAIPGKELNPHLDKHGYSCVGLVFKNKRIQVFMHRLMWETWVGRIPKGKEINHKDFDKTNYALWNLEVVTHLENLEHAWRNGRGRGKVPSVREVKQIRYLCYYRKYPYEQIAERFGVTAGYVKDLALGKNRNPFRLTKEELKKDLFL